MYLLLATKYGETIKCCWQKRITVKCRRRKRWNQCVTMAKITNIVYTGDKKKIRQVFTIRKKWQDRYVLLVKNGKIFTAPTVVKNGEWWVPRTNNSRALCTVEKNDKPTCSDSKNCKTIMYHWQKEKINRCILLAAKIMKLLFAVGKTVKPLCAVGKNNKNDKKRRTDVYY